MSTTCHVNIVRCSMPMRLGTYSTSVITCNANQPDKQYRRYVYEPCDIYVCVLYFFQKLVQYTCPYENPIARC